ncbi:MAG: restriction endonuclease subunit S [Parabacteroides sp.]|nr:restriction endonuclease subunit S [Parabacteroides sp.]
MALTKIRLGDYIERSTKNNSDLKYGSELIQGVTSKGVFDEPKGSQIDINLKPYKIVNNGAFVYNPSRLNLGSIAYRTEGLCIVSHLYIVFYLNDKGKEIIDPDYLFMYFRRDEFYREVTFRNFGSQRPEFNFNDMSDIIIPLPDIEIQRQYVDVYKAMVENQRNYERGLEDLKITCEEYLDELRKEHPHESIQEYIELVETKNDDLEYGINDVMGVSIEKKFIPTKADMMDVNLKPYYVVKPNEFAYVTVTSRNGGKISLALNESKNTYICSSSYVVFKSKDETKLLPQYLMLYFSRKEFDRYSRFCSWGSARETFEWGEMCDVKIPIPDIKIQKAIAEIYTLYITRKEINEKLKAQIKELCPVLIRGSLANGG